MTTVDDAAIEAWRANATADPCKPPKANVDGPYPMGYWLAAGEIEEAVTMLRTLRAAVDEQRARADTAEVDRDRFQAIYKAGHKPQCNGVDWEKRECACGWLQQQGAHNYIEGLRRQLAAAQRDRAAGAEPAGESDEPVTYHGIPLADLDVHEWAHCWASLTKGYLNDAQSLAVLREAKRRRALQPPPAVEPAP